jgi:hypothetical protein|tara:strand:+ start:13512 stop:14483 length:972 start_codon:yes stop_codon:yes gene_type:complete
MKKNYTIPIEQNKIDQLYNLWLNNGYDSINDIDIVEEHLNGIEKNISEIKLYTFETPTFIESSCITIYDKNLPVLAGLGEVCTEINSRGNGFAGKLCSIARDDFFSKNSAEAIFLGTINPKAQKIYENLGWVKIPRSKIMFNSKKGESFEDFINNYYTKTENSDIFINNGSPKFRISLIPYFFSQISNHNIDLNAYIIGNNYSSMCLSLYNKFDQITKNKGQWFVMTDHINKIYSTSSFKTISKDILRLDGTYKKGYEKYFIELLKNNLTAIDLLDSQRIICEVSNNDKDKIEIFRELGFRESYNNEIEGYKREENFKILEIK